MANFAIKFDVTEFGFDKVEEVKSRLKDFSIPLSNIIGLWAEGNARKFDESAGAELSGADEPPALWEPVTLKYYMQKHGPVKRGNRQTFPDWLMVRTGDLMRSLTTRGLFGEYFDQSKALFGIPLNDEERLKAAYNFNKRPTIFLGQSDRLMIKREFRNYLTLGGNYTALIFARQGQRSDIRRAVDTMNSHLAEIAAYG